MNLYAHNDGRFPDESDVEIRYPLTADQAERGNWPWVPGWIAGQCGPDEWDIVVEGAGPTSYDTDGEPLYSAAYRDSSEIRLPDHHAPDATAPASAPVRIDPTPAQTYAPPSSRTRDALAHRIQEDETC